MTAVAYAFARQAERATEQGLLQGYRTVEEALPVVRGRIREVDQMRRHFGLPVPIAVRFDEFTVDVAENQLLKGGDRAVAEASSLVGGGASNASPVIACPPC